MTYDWQMEQRPRRLNAATLLPPATVDEAGWDILLALHSNRASHLGLRKLASIVSLTGATVREWLTKLEDRQLISGAAVTGEARAFLTPAGRELLDRYLSATSDLQAGAHQ